MARWTSSDSGPNSDGKSRPTRAVRLSTAAITLKTTKPVRQFITSGDAGQQVRDDGSCAELSAPPFVNSPTAWATVGVQYADPTVNMLRSCRQRYGYPFRNGAQSVGR